MRTRIDRQRRQHRRFTVRFRPTGSNEAEHNGFTDNISGSGLFLQTSTVMPPGTRLELRLTVDGQPLDLLGVVEWAKLAPPQFSRTMRSGMGIRLETPLPLPCSPEVRAR